MDLIWKELSENQPHCRRLQLYSETDPGTAATFAVRCHTTIGVTSEENFANDAMYLVEGVLPDNRTLQSVELDWSFLQPLAAEERDALLKSVASLSSLQELWMRGGWDEESRIDMASLRCLPALAAPQLQRFSVEMAELPISSKADFAHFCHALASCRHLEMIHLRGLFAQKPSAQERLLNPTLADEENNTAAQEEEDLEIDLNLLFQALSSLKQLHTIHISQKDVHTLSASSSTTMNNGNPSNPNQQQGGKARMLPIDCQVLQQLCRLPRLASLSLLNMGLQDEHCAVLERGFRHSTALHSLILIDNPGISESGNATLLKLLQHNRAVFNSTYGTDSDTIHRAAQLTLLHLNRCGRAALVQPEANLDSWVTDYLTKINETVPEELELDALYQAVQENPALLMQYGQPKTSLIPKTKASRKQTVEVTPSMPPMMESSLLTQPQENRQEPPRATSLVQNEAEVEPRLELAPSDEPRYVADVTTTTTTPLESSSSPPPSLLLQKRASQLEMRERELALKQVALEQRLQMLHQRERLVQQWEDCLLLAKQHQQLNGAFDSGSGVPSLSSSSSRRSSRHHRSAEHEAQDLLHAWTLHPTAAALRNRRVPAPQVLPSRSSDEEVAGPPEERQPPPEGALVAPPDAATTTSVTTTTSNASRGFQRKVAHKVATPHHTKSSLDASGHADGHSKLQRCSSKERQQPEENYDDEQDFENPLDRFTAASSSFGANGSTATLMASSFSELERQTSATLEQFRDECWNITSISSTLFASPTLPW